MPGESSSELRTVRTTDHCAASQATLLQRAMPQEGREEPTRSKGLGSAARADQDLRAMWDEVPDAGPRTVPTLLLVEVRPRRARESAAHARCGRRAHAIQQMGDVRARPRRVLALQRR